ncbi:MAG: DUF177 domain-containing protein [Oscillospiraceae bacterium]
MVIGLKQLFDNAGASKDISCTLPTEVFAALKADPLASPVTVTGDVSNRAGIVKLRYTCTFTVLHTCDRCLKEFTRAYEFAFSHILVQRLSGRDESDEYVVCQDNTLDFDELAVSDLLLELPTKILCDEDCAGLCGTCGQDLNEGSCGCADSPPDAIR